MKTLILFYKIGQENCSNLNVQNTTKKNPFSHPSLKHPLAKLKKIKKPSQKFPKLSEYIKKGTEKDH